MNKLMSKGYFLITGAKNSLIKPFSNRRADENANEGGRGFVKILGLVLVASATLGVLTIAVGGINTGITGLKAKTDALKLLVIP